MSTSFMSDSGDPSAPPFDLLRQFARRRATRAPTEHCELCAEDIPPEHRHLLEVSSRALICACRACSILFGDPGAGRGKYRLVPSRYLRMPNFQMTDDQWDDLMIPVNMVYVFHDTRAKRVTAYYPSPAGAMESLLSLEGWDTLVNDNPILSELESDVEALLINRVENKGGDHYREHFIVPIDVCYELVGLIRLQWKGLSGGDDVWKSITEFFAGLRTKAITMGETQQAEPTPVRGGADAGSEL